MFLTDLRADPSLYSFDTDSQSGETKQGGFFSIAT